MIKKLFLGFYFILLLSCDRTEEVEAVKHNIVIAENIEFPKFDNQDIFIQAQGISIVQFAGILKKIGLKSRNMYVCMGDLYFVKENKYCIYFEHLWIQNPIQTDTGEQILALTAQHAYANKIFKDFFFHQASFSMKGENFVLFSNIVRWQADQNILTSPNNSKHLMKNKEGDILSGEELFLDYQSQFFILKHVELKLLEDI